MLRYLKGTSGKGILFKHNNSLALEVYTDVDYVDVDYAGSIVDSRFIMRYCTILGGNLVTWRSKKKNLVAKSLNSCD